MHDDTEDFRREYIANGTPQANCAAAERRWTPQELARDFTVHSFLAPFVIVTRKSDGAKGSMEFVHNPRFYFNFRKD